VDTEKPEALQGLLDHIRRHRGIDFGNYKSTTLKRRIGKRIQELGLAGYGSYLDYLQASPDEYGPLLDTLFINVTRFFRDQESWETLRRDVIPRLIGGASAAQPLRVWCAGVASGEEAYSVAMLLVEAMGEEDFAQNAKIFATDLDDLALQQARSATYTPVDLEEVPDDLRSRYFEPLGDRFQFRPDLRRAVIFGRHDLLEDAPISRLHLLICRNTLMYFNREAQGRVLARFHFALRPEGILFLGKAEMLLTRRNLFQPADGKARLFKKVTDLTFQDRVAVMSQVGGEDDQQAMMGEARLRDLAFDASSVPEIVVDGGGTLALANAPARSTFRIGKGDLGRPFHDLELSYKPVELRAPIEEARRERRQMDINNVEWIGTDGRRRVFDVRVLPLQDDGPLPAVKITFQDVSRFHVMNAELSELKRNTELAYEELQSTNEELETTNEELQSTVEELETTNEELQSTNEELETMNEELQSTNVEIETVNEELRERTGQLDDLNSYTRAILDGLGMAVVVLDRELKVRTWNGEAEELWGLRAADVEGRPFLELDIGLPSHELSRILQASVAEAGGRTEHRIGGHDRRGKQVGHAVTVMPLRGGTTGRVDGVILLVEGKAGKSG
jgi:two-component system, chemotaxis family, CheB/CheR fusion protein